MSHLFKIACALLLLFSALATKSQTLGNYPNTSVISGQNVMITPDALPTSTTSIVAYTNTNFSGILTVNPVTGILQVTNAKHAGTYLVTVKAFGALPATKTFTLTITNPECSQGQFTNGIEIANGSLSFSFGLGDFNSDGNQDIAIANYNNSNVSIRLGDGNGGFTQGAIVIVGNLPRSIVIGDFNGDGKQDMATANYNTNTLSIRLGDGLGGFPNGSEVSVGNSGYLTIGDFNNDGKEDLAILNGIIIRILFGDGLGGFSENSQANFGLSIHTFTIGDFNNDGNQDLATVSLDDSSTISIGLGDGNGGFIKKTSIIVGPAANSIIVGDFNGDGKQDLATANRGTANQNNNTVSILLGDGLGGFIVSNTIKFGLGYSVNYLALCDFNGDGFQDIANAEASPYVTILFGDGAGGFIVSSFFRIGDRPEHLAIADFNGDGKQDFATVNRNRTTSIRIGNNEGKNTWLGLTSEWNKTTNWSLGIIPSACAKLVVNTGVPFLPTITGINNTCFSLTLNNGAIINMATGAKLNITGK